MGSRTITILGAGPAGSAAAIAAAGEGAIVRVLEKSRLPRHKVCGEFFSPEIQSELDRFGVWGDFLAAGPARIHRMKLHFGRTEKICRLREPAWGLSRFAFDALMARAAAVETTAGDETPSIIASGRSAIEPRGKRLFGFKAHFDGPADDAVELFFFEDCYVGVSSVEGGCTNVCGLGPEDFLRRLAFDFDAVLGRSPALAARTAPLRRSMPWLSTGPLRFEQNLAAHDHAYRAGDALSFVDPFTGSGLLAAVKTGTLAGTFAARGASVAEYQVACKAILGRPFEVASIFRGAVRRGWAEWLAGLVPGRVLFALTRPKV
jgi:flavin-dependent dehydrogenase